MSVRGKIYLVPWLGFVMALGMHLWHLDQPAQLVSDEFSFVNEGHDYVTHQNYFDPHPPLGKLELGVVFSLAGYSPFTWRVLNAVEGALIVPLLWWLVWRLTRQRVAANVVVILALLDGFLLVESRLGLINVPYILYSLSALACVLKALEQKRPGWWLLSAGILIGAAVSVKWLALLIIIPAIILWWWPGLFGQPRAAPAGRRMNLLAVSALLVLPLVIYSTAFWLHFHWLGIQSNFWPLNAQMLNYHLSVPATGDPYANQWWGWLLLWRPFVYWSHDVGQKLSSIWSLPNPWTWWTGVVIFLYSLVRGWREPATRLLATFLLITWIPFALIHRIMYSYHAMLFDMVLLMLVAVWLGQRWDKQRQWVVAYLIAAALVFVWFAPLYLHLPLSIQQQHWRQWLPAWSADIQTGN